MSYKRTNTIEILGEVLNVVHRVKGTNRKRDGVGGGQEELGTEFVFCVTDPLKKWLTMMCPGAVL